MTSMVLSGYDNGQGQMVLISWLEKDLLSLNIKKKLENSLKSDGYMPVEFESLEFLCDILDVEHVPTIILFDSNEEKYRYIDVMACENYITMMKWKEKHRRNGYDD